MEDLTPRERLAVRYAELMHQRPATCSQADVDAMLEAFTPEEFMEMAFTVAQFISMGQLVHALGVPNPTIVPFNDEA
ncbi:MAG: hypothetical protein ACKO91_15395 [Acidimicrobiales bacterium]